jgi:hypothetical protein
MRKRIGFVALAIGLGLSLLAYNNCSGGFESAGGSSSGSASLQSTGVSQLQLNFQVKNSATQLVYDDSVPNSSLTLSAGQSYSFIINTPTQPPAGATLQLTLTEISVIGAQPQVLTLNYGSNAIPSNLLNQGNYSFEFSAAAPGMATVTKSYTAAVSCPNPTFTKASLNPSAIQVSLASANNIFNYSVAGVIANANGSGNYECALDPSGTSILDTGFQSCSAPFTAYSSAVSTRNVNVVVLDKTCNISYSVSSAVNLPYTEPTLGQGHQFIFGQTSNATGSAVGDSRVANLTYLATNEPNNTIVQSSLNGSSFTIQSSQNYQQASSVNYGITISLSGITGSVSTSTGVNNLSVANASIQGISYSTDEAGDSQVALSFSGTNCALSQQHVAVSFLPGSPCGSGTSGDQNSVSVEIWGHYVCTGVSDSTGSFSIEGDFDGASSSSDNCQGGTTGVTGGVVPISL